MNYLVEKVKATSDNPVVSESAAAVKREAAIVAKSPVKLLDAGSEPRKVLRLHPVAGDKQSLSMTMKMAMIMSAAGNAMPAMNLPAMVMGMEVEVKDVSSTGEITYTMLFNDVSMATDTNSMPGVADAMKSAFATMRGMSGTGKVSDHGIIKSMEMKLPDGADPQMAQAMDQMKDSFHNSSTALPEEAVGVGAKWEYKTKMKSQGMVIDQSITYELVSIEGDTLTLHTTVTQTAANQKMENPAMPGLKVDLNKMTGTGTGGNTLDLGHLMPASGTLDEETEINMGMNIGQQKQAMNMKMNIKVTLEAK